MAKAPSDGYTLLVGGSAYILAPLLQATPYDPVIDFSPISLVGIAPAIVVVHPSLPVKSVKDLVAFAKVRPRELNYSSSVLGGSAHLAAELFNSMAGIKIVQIVYKGVGPALTGVIGGEVHVTFATAESALPHMKSGRLRALAVTSAQPSALAPGLPTVAASNLPGYEAIALYAISAPAKTPMAIINRLNYEIRQVLNRAEVKQKLLYSGVEPVGSSPQELAAKIKSEMALWGKVIKDSGMVAK